MKLWKRLREKKGKKDGEVLRFFCGKKHKLTEQFWTLIFNSTHMIRILTTAGQLHGEDIRTQIIKWVELNTKSSRLKRN